MPYHADARADLERHLHDLDPDLRLVDPEQPEFPAFLAAVSAQDATLARRINDAVLDEQAQEARELFGKASEKGNAMTVLGAQLQRAKGRSARGTRQVRPVTFAAGAGGLLLVAVLVTAMMPEKKGAVGAEAKASETSPAVTPAPAPAGVGALPQSTKDESAITPAGPAADTAPITPTAAAPTPAAPAPVDAYVTPTPTPVSAPVTPAPVTPMPVSAVSVPVTSAPMPDPYVPSAAPVTAAPAVTSAPTTPVTVVTPSAFTGTGAPAPTPERVGVVGSREPAPVPARAAVVSTTPDPAAPRAALTATAPDAAPAARVTGGLVSTGGPAPSASGGPGLVSSSSSGVAPSRGALVSAPQGAAGGFVSASGAAAARTVTSAPAAAPSAPAAVTAAPVASVPGVEPGAAVQATLTTPVAVYPGVTHPVWARSADGGMWRGVAALDEHGRITLSFTVLLKGGAQVPVTAYAESADGPGIGGRVRTASPNAARTALNGLLTGVQSFVQSQAARTSTVSPSGLVTTQERPQNFWLALSGNLAQAFVVPETKAQVVPFGQLSAGEPVTLRVDVTAKP